MKYTLEVIQVPVSDVARATAFDADQVGFHLDFDLGGAVVQLTPPGSGCSIQIGRDRTSTVPGPSKGSSSSSPISTLPTESSAPEGSNDRRFRSTPRTGSNRRVDDDLNNVGVCTFADPDGNRWIIQQISVSAGGGPGGLLGDDYTDVQEMDTWDLRAFEFHIQRDGGGTFRFRADHGYIRLAPKQQ